MAGQLRFKNPEFENLRTHVRYAAALGLPMVEGGCHADAPGAIIAGCGPSLADPKVKRAIRDRAKADWIVFGLKEAITLLRKARVKVTYSVNMDPQPLEIERTPVYEDVTYCIATSCHPRYLDYVRKRARVLLYHSACGVYELDYKPGYLLELGGEDYSVVLGKMELATADNYSFCPIVGQIVNEPQLYNDLFGNATVMCGGYTCGNRAIALAKFMGIDQIEIAGLDFGWRDDAKYYANGIEATPIDMVFMQDHGAMDGRNWHTRGDLLLSAIDLVKRMRHDGKIRVLGDSLVNALLSKSDEELDEICKVT